MSNYCSVENGEVTYAGELPKVWRNVSGLHLATEASLKEKGWLPYTVEEATLSEYEVKDGLKYTINVDNVVGVEQKRNMTDEEKIAYDLQVTTKYQRDRARAYPSIEDQLDKIYHDGVTKWKSEMIKPIKDAHPKPL